MSIEPDEFPNCISCDSSHQVDIDEIDNVWICRNCCIQWEKN